MSATGNRISVIPCDDVSRVPLRPPFLRRFVLALMARSLLGRARRIARENGSAILIANRDLLGPPPPGLEVVEPAHVVIQGAVDCDVPALHALGGHIAAVLDESLKGTPGEGLGAITELRLVLSPMLEYLVRPGEGFAAWLRSRKATDLYLFSGTSAFERIAAGVAGNQGVKVHPAPVSPWRPFFALRHVFWSRNRFLETVEGITRHWSRAAEKQPGNEHEHLVIFAEEERRLRRLGPMAKAMIAAGIRVRVVSNPFKKEARNALAELAAQGIPTSYLSDYLRDNAAETARRAMPQLQAAWAKVAADPRSPGFLYRGVSVWNVFRKHFEKSWFVYALSGWFSKSCAENLFEAHRPKKLIVMEVGLYSKILLNVAKRRGIESYWYINNPILFTTAYWLPLVLPGFRADNAIVTGEYMRDQLIARGFYKESEIITSGDMNLPKIERTPARSEEARDRWNIPTGRKALLCLSSYLSADVTVEKLRQFHQETARLAEAAGCSLIIKAHPNQQPGGLKEQLESWGVKYAAFFHTEPLMELLLASDVAVMMFSQAGAEVLMAGVPLVILQENGMAEQSDAQFPYVAEGAAKLLLLGAAGNEQRFRELLNDPSALEAQNKRAERFVSHFVSVRHPDNAAFLAEQLNA